MDPTTVADTFGTYRPTQQTTPTQRRVLRWWNRTVLAAATIWLLVLVLRNDLGAALPILVWIVVAAAVSTTSTLIGRRLGPVTRIDANGISSSTGLTGGRRSTRWSEMAYIDEPQRFETSHAAVLTSGVRLELPGLSAPVIKRLNDALGMTPSPAPRPPQKPSPASTDPDQSWEGPFHHG